MSESWEHTFKDEDLHHENYRVSIEEINDDAIELIQEFRRFIDISGLFPNPDDVIVHSWPRSRKIITCWRRDLDRHRAFHLKTGSYPNIYKQASYLAWWISKIKPAFAIPPDKEFKDEPAKRFSFKHVALIEAFAVHMAINKFLQIKIDEISNKTFRDLVRQLFFRNTCPKLLASYLEELHRRVVTERKIISRSEMVQTMSDPGKIKSEIQGFVDQIKRAKLSNKNMKTFLDF